MIQQKKSCAMPFEIERRYIIQDDGWKVLTKEMQEFHQAYLSTNFDEWVIRTRIINNKESEITLKKSSELMINHEFEYPIPLKDALCLWDLSTKKLIKHRYQLDLSPGDWVIDCFMGNNYPLVLAEVELSSKAEVVQKPSWCGQEITGIKKLSNAALAQLPLSDWSSQELQSFNLQ